MNMCGVSTYSLVVRNIDFWVLRVWSRGFDSQHAPKNRLCKYAVVWAGMVVVYVCGPTALKSFLRLRLQNFNPIRPQYRC